MSTVRKVRRRREPIQYAATRRVVDPKCGAAAHALYRAGIAGTPGAAHQLMLRRRDEMLVVVGTLSGAGLHDELDAWLAPVDEIRSAGIDAQLDASAIVELDRIDGQDNPARTDWIQSRCTRSARIALIATRRTIRSLQRFVRHLLTSHPELAR